MDTGQALGAANEDSAHLSWRFWSCVGVHSMVRSNHLGARAISSGYPGVAVIKEHYELAKAIGTSLHSMRVRDPDSLPPVSVIPAVTIVPWTISIVRMGIVVPIIRRGSHHDRWTTGDVRHTPRYGDQQCEQPYVLHRFLIDRGGHDHHAACTALLIPLCTSGDG